MRAAFLLLLIFGVFGPCFAYAAGSNAKKEDVEKFYRPVTSKDLVTKLPPRIDKDKLLDTGTAFFSDQNGGCPDTISIGSVDSETDIFGDVNIDVYIGNDVYINCGGLQ